MRAYASLTLLCLQLGTDAFTPSTKLVQMRPRSKLEAAAALEWDDNVKWLDQCQKKQVVSWYDAGLRLTKPAASSFSSSAAPEDSASMTKPAARPRKASSREACIKADLDACVLYKTSSS